MGLLQESVDTVYNAKKTQTFLPTKFQTELGDDAYVLWGLAKLEVPKLSVKAVEGIREKIKNGVTEFCGKPYVASLGNDLYLLINRKLELEGDTKWGPGSKANITLGFLFNSERRQDSLHVLDFGQITNTPNGNESQFYAFMRMDSKQLIVLG